MLTHSPDKSYLPMFYYFPWHFQGSNSMRPRSILGQYLDRDSVAGLGLNYSICGVPSLFRPLVMYYVNTYRVSRSLNVSVCLISTVVVFLSIVVRDLFYSEVR